jgi:fatty acid desaturase
MDAMDEVFAPTDVLDKRVLKRLSRRSDLKGAVQVLSHGAALTLAGALVWRTAGTAWLALSLPLYALLLIFLFAPLHETIHRTAFRTKALNDAVAWVCGAVLLLPPGYFRAFHFTHHRHTQDPARDPELATPKPATLRGYLWLATGLPFWRERSTMLLRHALIGQVDESFIIERLRPAIAREARLLLTLYAVIAVASILTGSWAAVLLWIAPALIGQPALRLYLLAEHTGCPLVPDMFENSRTIVSNRLVRWLAWNMPFHVEHHAYPAVPFHAQPAAHEVIKERIAVQAPGYLAAQRDILAGLKTNVII